MSDVLQKLKKEKFGNLENSEGDFGGPHDPSEAPNDFQLNVGGKEFHISGFMSPNESGSVSTTYPLLSIYFPAFWISSVTRISCSYHLCTHTHTHTVCSE